MDELSLVEKNKRVSAIVQVITELEESTQVVGTVEQRTSLMRWLNNTCYTVKQIQAAKEIVACMETYGRPLAREFWFRAFNEPVIHPQQVHEIRRRAREEGYQKRLAEEQVEDQEASRKGYIDSISKQLLERQQECWNLKEELHQAHTTIHQLRKERRAAWSIGKRE